MLWAASMGHTECLTLLVNAGADVNAKDNVYYYSYFSSDSYSYYKIFI